MTRQQRRAEARGRAKESLRKQGGQPGHEGKARELASAEEVDRSFEHLPRECSGHLRRQRAEPGRAARPPEVGAAGDRAARVRALKASSCLPGLRQGRSRRAAGGGVPLGPRAADGGPHRHPGRRLSPLAPSGRRGRARGLRLPDLARRGRSDDHADERGLGGSLGRACARPCVGPRLSMPTRRAGACAVPSNGCGSRPRPSTPAIGSTPRRSRRAAKELIGEDFGGFVVSDRYAGYHFLDISWRRVCDAALRRACDYPVRSVWTIWR